MRGMARGSALRPLAPHGGRAGRSSARRFSRPPSRKNPQQRVELVPAARVDASREPRIVAILARQQRQRDAAFARQRRQPLDAVAPPVETAEQADHDHLGVRADAVDPEVDRHRMAQVAQIGEPHARKRRRAPSPTQRRARRGRCRRTTARRRRPAAGRDRPARRSRRASWKWSRADASLIRATSASRRRDRVPSVR